MVKGYRSETLLSVLLLTLILSCGMDTPLKEYQPQTPQEAALKTLLLDFQEGFNSKDTEKIKQILHPGATLKIEANRKVLSKAEYIKILPERMVKSPPISLGRPKMTVTGSEAEVKVYMVRGKARDLVIFYMVLEDTRWTIKSWNY